MKKELVLGIDIGGTNTKIGIFLNKKLIATDHFRTQKESAQEFFKFIHKKTLLLIKEHNLINEPIYGVGVGAPMTNAVTGLITYAHNLGWRDINIKKDFTDLFSVPVFVDNDANLAALGEAIFGSGRGAESFLLLTLGTGVGTGLVINNKIVRGYLALGGEGGHVIIDSPKKRKCPCGGINHIEAYLGAQGVKQTLKENGLEIDIRELSTYIKNKNPQALEVLNSLCEELSTAIVNMCVLIGPQRIILAGGISQMGEVFLSALEEKVNDKIFYSLKNKMTFHLAEVSTEMGAIYGGAALVYSELS